MPSPLPTKQLVVCHLADIHLGFRRYQKLTKQGFNQREADVNQAFREVVDRLIQLQPDLVLIAGDLFHSVRPSNAVITFCFQQLKRLALNTKADLVIIAGNHESPKRVDSGSILRLFKEIERTYIADTEPKVFVVAGGQAQVLCLPHASLINTDLKLPQPNNNVTYNFLLAHAQVAGNLKGEFSTGEYGAVRIDFATLAPHSWDYIALGHVHSHSIISYNAAYSGAIEHTSSNSWQAANNSKGFVEFRLPERTIKFHAITSLRSMLTLAELDASDLTPEEVLAELEKRINSVQGGIQGKILRIEVFQISRATLKNLDHSKIRQLKSAALHFQINFRPQLESSLNIQENTGARITLQDELRRYFSQAANSAGLNNPLVEQLMVGYLNKVEKLDEAL